MSYIYYSDCLQRHRLRSTKLLVWSKKFVMKRLILFLKMIFGRYQHIVKKYCVPCLQMTRDDIGNYILNLWPLFLYYVFLLVCVPFDIWMRIKALCSLKYRTSIIHMITLSYNKNVDIKECMNIWCMKFKMLAELSLQQRCSPSYLSVSAFNQRGVVNTFMKWRLGLQTSQCQHFTNTSTTISWPNHLPKRWGLGPQYSKYSERSCYLCVTISILPVSTIFLLEFWIFLTMSRLVNQMVST